MSTVGIVAEYDPFHRGHLYQMQQARERTGADTVVVVLGGDFLQRGTPSMTDKRRRARMAADAGADLVLALPYIFSVNSAHEYAEGAVRILSGIGCVDYLSFGCENEDLPALNRAASIVAREAELSPLIREKLTEGVSYPEALTQAAASLGGQEVSVLLRKPNNLLACEYLRAVKALDSPLEPVPVQRVESAGDHKTNGETETGYLSASQIRLLMEEKGVSLAEPYLPVHSIHHLREAYQNQHPGVVAHEIDDRMLGFLRYRLRTADRRELSEVYSLAEGFENRLISAAADPRIRTVSELAESAGTRRYTRARIMRMLVHILINFKREDFELLREVSCARVLACSRRGRKLLGRMRKTADIPVLSNLAGWSRFDERLRRLIELEIRAAEIYGMLRGDRDSIAGEIRYIPYMAAGIPTDIDENRI